MAIGERFQKEIKVKVKKSDQELKKDELVNVDREIQRVANEKAGDMAEYNQELKVLRERQRKLLDVIKDGEETIEVECVEEADERRLEVKIIRCDTGEVIDRRPMTADERQVGLSEVTEKKKRGGRKPAAEDSAEA